jgi:hypothetical protein
VAQAFRLSTPLMRGATELQRNVNREFGRWKVPLKIDEDDEYGPQTKHATKHVAYGLGVRDAANIIEHQGCTAEIQSAIHDPHAYVAENPDALRRYQARAGWRRRLARRFKGHGVEMAVRYAHKMADTRVEEQPSGSNLGPFITDWERLTGYSPPPGVFWCGCFVNACLVAGGFHPQHFLGFVPAIEQQARGGVAGWSWHAEPAAGDVACFGGGEHTEFVVENGNPLRTVGGNTSAGNGSPNNGGGVFFHDYGTYRGLTLDGFARPPWAQLA